MTSHRIVRTRPEALGQKPGIAVPAFIRNGTYFFTELEIYADGMVECWGAVDLDFLARKFDSGWISPTAPNGANISFHDLIQGKVVSGHWSHDRYSLHKRLLDCLQELNPSMESLIDFEGSDVEDQAGVRYAKIGITEGQPCQLNQGRRTPAGNSRYAFVREKGQVFLTVLRIYADGGIDVHPRYGDENVIDHETFEKMVLSNDISVTVPNGTMVEIDSFGRFELTEVRAVVEHPTEFLREVADVVWGLKGEPDAIANCREVFQEYLATPTVQNRERLKQAYEAVPEHNRMYVGDMDTKDIPVRMVIYGDEEIEKWSHLAVARALGRTELPSIEVPKPIDEGTDAGAERQ